MNEVSPTDQKVWDKKKIAIFLLILLLVGGVLSYGFENQKLLPQKEVRGTQTIEQKEEPKVEPPSLTNLQNTFEERFNDVRKEAEKIDVAEVASSSPQVQKVINDIKSLQNYPQSRAKEACFNICEGL